MSTTARATCHSVSASLKKQERKRFLQLAEDLIRSRDLVQQKRLKAQLERMIFG